jgi:hypothetical protein
MTKFKISTVLLFAAATVLAVGLTAVSPTRAQDDDQGGDQSRIRQGLNALPFDLNLRGKNIALVGLGSYFVNVAGDCNGCHTSDQANPYLPGGNPYLGQTERIDPSKYLVGGTVFIPLFHGISDRKRTVCPRVTLMPSFCRSSEPAWTSITHTRNMGLYCR